MDKKEEPKGWSPYLAGALAGLLLIFSVWFTGKYIGASTTFVKTAGLIEKIMNYPAAELRGIKTFKDRKA
jgi:hypothetical protein